MKLETAALSREKVYLEILCTILGTVSIFVLEYCHPRVNTGLHIKAHVIKYNRS